MTQPTFSAVRSALATTLSTQIPGLRAVASRIQVNPPAAVVMPVTGTFAYFSQTFDGTLKYMLRAILLVSEGDSSSGMDLIDPYISTTGPQSVWAAVQANPTLSGVVTDAFVSDVASYGLMSWMGVDYLAAHFTVQVLA